MMTKALLSPILDDDRLTRGLGDPEARQLVEWLVDWAERRPWSSEDTARRAVERQCRRARAISRFVHLWCYQDTPGSAGQLAASEGFTWPLPVRSMDPCDLMEEILRWEGEIVGD